MDMKEHILMALKEQFARWEELLTNLTEEQTTTSRFDSNWSIKDVIAHLWGWQQISIARVEAAKLNQEPEFPKWIEELGKDWDEEENTNQTNAWIYKTYQIESWSEIYQNWREGFLKLLDSAESIPEKYLLDESRYSWLHGYSLAFILMGSYDHHREHLDELFATLKP